MSDGWGKIENGCPVCGGTVDWYVYSPDCRGNPGSNGVRCLANGCLWSEEQMRAFWSDVLARSRAQYERASRNE